MRVDVAHQHRGEILGQRHARAAGEVDGDRVLPGERGDAPEVVVVLVRHDDPGEVRGYQAHAAQPVARFRDGEAAIHEDPGTAALDHQAVARAAAPEGGETKGHCNAALNGTVRSNARPAASNGTTNIYFNWSKSSVMILLPVFDWSAAPCSFCTTTLDMLAPASATWMRYCGCFEGLVSVFQNLSL